MEPKNIRTHAWKSWFHENGALKIRALGCGGMYKELDKVPEFEKIYLPFGGHLRDDKRWVRLAVIFPCEEIGKRYAGHFSKHIGRTAKTERLALGSLLIKEKLKLTDEETVENIRENPYLQYFLGYESYDGAFPQEIGSGRNCRDE